MRIGKYGPEKKKERKNILNSYHILYFVHSGLVYRKEANLGPCQTYRSCPSQMFFKKGALKNLAKFTGNTCVGAFKFINLRNLYEYTFFTGHLRWLLPKVV